MIGRPAVSDDALTLLRRRLLEHPAIGEAYLIEIEIVQPTRGTSRATNLALWLGPDAEDGESSIDRLSIVNALMGSPEVAGMEMSVLAPAGRAAARRRGLRIL